MLKANWVLAACCAAALISSGCGSSADAGPTQTASEQVDAGKADTVTAEIRMSAGTLKIEGGAPNLLSADFRYSESIGRPVVAYDVAGAHGRLVVHSASGGRTNGNAVHEWNLRLGNAVPLDLSVGLGAGESHLDVAQLALRSLEVNMGAGEMTLDMAGKYMKDVTVQVNGGVGEAKIRLPKATGAVVDAAGGIGGVSAHGLTKRDDGKYYNDAYADDKPAVRMKVRGGVGDINLTVGD